MSDRLDPGAVFDALGDPVRRQIIEVLGRGEQPVGRIADELPVGRPAVSKHLHVLEAAGLVRHRRAGTRNLYALAPEGLAAAQHWLARSWERFLASFVAPSPPRP